MPTADDIRARIETDLDVATLTDLIAAESQALDAHAGSATVSVVIDARGTRVATVNRPIDTVISIVERAHPTSDPVTLDTTDWRQIDSYRLLRLSSGTNPSACWAGETTVTYTPRVDLALRERVVVDLVRLAIEFRAFDKEKIDGWEAEQGDYFQRRNTLLNQVTEGRLPIV